jgi:hypothetical protein
MRLDLKVNGMPLSSLSSSAAFPTSDRTAYRLITPELTITIVGWFS